MQTNQDTGSLSRRQFLKVTALVMSTFASTSILAACQAPAPSPTAAPTQEAVKLPQLAVPTQAPAQPTATAAAPTQAPTTAAQPTKTAQPAAKPKIGGTYRIFGVGDFRTLDPPGAESSEDWWSAGMVLFNMLYFYDKDGKFYADLAADLPKISEGGLVYTIPLRKGVKFHNGREMTAEDVKFSLERQLWPEVYSWGKTYMDNVVGYKDVIDGKTKDLKGIKVVDPYTVEIRLEKPQAVFPAILTMSMNAIIPKKETLDAGKDWGSKVVIGTGPFKFVEWQQGRRAVYERNPNYFKPGLPYLERIELYLNTDPAVQMLRWESNQAEAIHDIPDAELPRIISDPKLSAVLRRTPGIGTNRLAMHFKVKPFDDIRVRQAIAMAIDKQAIAKKHSGTITPIEGFYAPPMLQFDKNFKSKYQFDQQKAKDLMAQAGQSGGVKGVKLYGSKGLQTRLEMIQADLRSIGITADLAIGQWKEWRDKIRGGEVALFVYGWAASFPDAYDFVSAWTTCASSETGYNDGFYCNKKIDDLLAEAEKLPLQDPKRVEAYRQIEDIVINQDVAWVGIDAPQRLMLGKEYVHDDFLSGIYGWPYLETAWMDKP